MKILVTGGTGFVGQRLAQALLAQGHTVRVMGRNLAAAQAALAAGATPVLADLRDTAAVVAACAGTEAIYHVGALSAPWGARRDFVAINVQGTQRVIAGARRAGVGRLIYVSSPSVVFDGGDQRDLTEAAPYPPRFASVYSWSKKLAEDAVRAATDLETVIIRPKAIFGPGDTTLLPRLIDAARRGRLPQIGDGHNAVDLTYIDNVVYALVLALRAPAAVGNTYHITNDEHPQLWAVIRTVLQRLGLSTQLPPLPLGAALALAGAMEAAALVTRREPLLTRYSVSILARTQTYDLAAARRDLGYRPPVSVAAGIERTLASLAR